MAISVTKLLEIILLIAGTILVFGFLAGIVSAVSGNSFACKLSVMTVSYGISDSLNCRISEVDLPEREFKRETAERFIAEKMLECHQTFGASREEPIKSQDWIETSPAALIRVTQGNFPDGRLFDNTLPIWNRLNPFKEGERQYCSVCSVITLPEDRAIEGFQDYLVQDTFRSVPFADRFYASDERSEHYLLRNSDSFVPDDTGEPAVVVVFYTEGEYKDGPTIRKTAGVVAMNPDDFITMVGSETTTENLCMRYLA